MAQFSPLRPGFRSATNLYETSVSRRQAFEHEWHTLQFFFPNHNRGFPTLRAFAKGGKPQKPARQVFLAAAQVSEAPLPHIPPPRCVLTSAHSTIPHPNPQQHQSLNELPFPTEIPPTNAFPSSLTKEVCDTGSAALELGIAKSQ